MKKLLPIVSSIFIVLFTLVVPLQSFAQTPPVATATPDPNLQVGAPNVTPNPDDWAPDDNVTFIGKGAARAEAFLDWTLTNFQWQYVPKNGQQPLLSFWATIRNIVLVLLLLFVLASAFIIIITRGRNLTIRRFVLRFTIIVILIVFSYFLLALLYEVGDIIQGFFLHNPDYPKNSPLPFITGQNLLYIGFDYTHFQGLERVGADYRESAFITLLLVKLTAITYYVMTGILLIRKIILWFFIVVSPIFPLLLFYAPIRNTGKIWVGEFFRWLLYAPLFAVLLSGLVDVWRSFIPLQFDFVQNPGLIGKGPQVYQTAVNILIGGPKQPLAITNSINYNDTFAQYIVALLMLWVVIILPFLLLQIFLDYLNSYSFAESAWMKQLVARGGSYFGAPPKPEISPSPPPPAGAGIARQLPFSSKMAMPLPTAVSIATSSNVSELKRSEITTEVMNTTNLSVPKMQDIAKFETAQLSSVRSDQLSQSRSTLEKIANPNLASNSTERQHFVSLRGKLDKAKESGDPLAASILTAANATQSTSAVVASGTPGHPTVASSKVEEELQNIRDKAHSPGAQLHTAQKLHNAFPAINRVQTVSIEDYESVKKMWKDTYSKVSPPKEDGQEQDRKAWIKQDIDKINEVSTLLSSANSRETQQGMDMVAKILPFLLIGGFSQTEVLAYLKAKQEAAKEVLEDLDKNQQEEEETTIETAGHHKKEAAKEEAMELEDPVEEEEKVVGEKKE